MQINLATNTKTSTHMPAKYGQCARQVQESTVNGEVLICNLEHPFGESNIKVQAQNACC